MVALKANGPCFIEKYVKHKMVPSMSLHYSFRCTIEKQNSYSHYNQEHVIVLNMIAFHGKASHSVKETRTINNVLVFALITMKDREKSRAIPLKSCSSTYFVIAINDNATPGGGVCSVMQQEM